MSEHPHTELLDLAYPYALDALSDDDRRAVEQLLSTADETAAAAFRTTVRDIHETMATMTEVDARPAPPAVETALQRALDAQQAESASGTGGPGSPSARRSWRVGWLAAAAALIAVIALGVTVAVYRSDSPDSGAVTAEKVQTHSDTRTATVDVGGGGTITVSASRDLNTAAVSFAAVPPPATGRTYQLWVIPAGAQPHSLAVLATLPTARDPMLMPLTDADKLALSVEPAGGSPQPTTDPLVAVQLR
ncbi:anti-sigma factor domain-containing protein [Nocardia sp. NPDC056100]|uniref:anti-sigma factor n=1 Tax=Nocardia sp. NPDC056100 TaxID=3345712 RepID=UPI0035D9716D